jgi:hypothetical protein
MTSINLLPPAAVSRGQEQRWGLEEEEGASQAKFNDPASNNS